MILTWHIKRQRFEFECEYQEKNSQGELGRIVAKNARFRFDWENKVWFACDAPTALKMAAYCADPQLRSRIHQEAMETGKPSLRCVNSVFIWTGPIEGDVMVNGKRVTVNFKDLAKSAGLIFAKPHTQTWASIPRDAAAGITVPVWWTTDPEKAMKCSAYADDTAKTALRDMIEKKKVSLAASRATDAEIIIPVPEGIHPRTRKPFAYLGYQKAGVAYAIKRPKSVRGTLFGDEMGLGKSVEAIGFINYYLPRLPDEQIKNLKILLICPASLKLNWAQEMRWWLVRPLTIGLSDTKRAQVIPNTNVVITNFEQLGQKQKTGKQIVDEGAADRQREAGLFAVSSTPMKDETVVVLRQSLKITWDVLIVDEAHKIKSEKALRTRLTLSIVARHNLFLTGTPLVNRPRELWVLAHHLAPSVFVNKWDFLKRYCDGGGSYFGNSYDGGQHLDELQEKMRTWFMIRRLKKDVLTELPPKRRQVIELPATGCEHLVSAELIAWESKEAALRELKLRVELAKASDRPEDYTNAVNALRQGIKVAFEEMSKVRHDTAIAKIPAVKDHLAEALSEGNKVILFAHHKEVVYKIAQHFASECVTLTGDTKMGDRDAAVRAFQENPKVTLFIGTIMAAGVGLTLTASSHVVFAELDWVPGNVTQAEDRAHRIGQLESVLIQHLVLEGSLDKRMADTLIEKQEVSDQALDRETGPVLDLDLVSGDAPTPIYALPDKDEFATHAISRKDIDKDVEKITRADIEAVHMGIQILAERCDGATAEDGAGFARFDVTLGHTLAKMSNLTPRFAILGKKLLQKYSQTQLAGIPELQQLFTKEKKTK